MIIALYGSTCVGKSSIAKELSALLPCNIRGCGGEVFAFANSAGIAPDDLSDADHREIDRRTLELCNEEKSMMIVEGRFLQYVLSSCKTKIILIELHATADVRTKRLLGRNRSYSTANRVEDIDRADEGFCLRLYDGVSPSEAHFSLDTSTLQVSDYTNKINSFIQTQCME